VAGSASQARGPKILVSASRSVNTRNHQRLPNKVAAKKRPDVVPAGRSENMRRIRNKDTAPEMFVRRLVFAEGYRYRLHRKDLPGKPDLVFPSRRKVVFVHGCYWHAHGCKRAHNPLSNTSYWAPKLTRNAARDAENIIDLTVLGWDALVIWECEISQREIVTSRIREFLDHPAPKIDTSVPLVRSRAVSAL
jgi:DNA mismatch endonuclease, patch repair protein